MKTSSIAAAGLKRYGFDAATDRIASALKWPSVQAPFDFDGWWQDIALAARAQFLTPAGENAPDHAGQNHAETHG